MTASIAQQKIRIRLKAFDRRMLDLSCDKIIQTADNTSASAIGPIPLPTKRKIYCVLRSPHVDKDSREHFEIRIHKRQLPRIYNWCGIRDARVASRQGKSNKNTFFTNSVHDLPLSVSTRDQ